MLATNDPAPLPNFTPVAFENLLILTFDGADLQYHAALDKQTGKTVWKTDRSAAWNDENVPGQLARDGDLRKAHSTPLIVNSGGKPQMISAGAKAAYGYDPRTGRELWRVQHPDYSVAPRPLFDHGLAFFVTGNSLREMWAVKTDGPSGYNRERGPLAQRLEQGTHNPLVEGSNPSGPTKILCENCFTRY